MLNDPFQAEPPYERHPHPASRDGDELLTECELGRGRSGGPGGQHRNKVQTLVVLTHRATEISAQAGERRSAIDNKRVALARLRLALATQHRTGVIEGDARSALWRSRVDKNGKISISERHHDFAAMLAEAMDHVWAAGLEPRKAAIRLCCTPSQLLKLLAKHPPALGELNRARTERGKHALQT
ncbi:MAG: peptide chain release factor-like protein [Planctomycetota bacterium]